MVIASRGILLRSKFLRRQEEGDESEVIKCPGQQQRI